MATKYELRSRGNISTAPKTAHPLLDKPSPPINKILKPVPSPKSPASKLLSAFCLLDSVSCRLRAMSSPPSLSPSPSPAIFETSSKPSLLDRYFDDLEYRSALELFIWVPLGIFTIGLTIACAVLVITDATGSWGVNPPWSLIHITTRLGLFVKVVGAGVGICIVPVAYSRARSIWSRHTEAVPAVDDRIPEEQEGRN